MRVTAASRKRRFGPQRDSLGPKKMADMVANHIRRMVARGQILDGAWLPTETELLGQFDISRPTLREAFRLLEADSLVSIRRGPPGGAQVNVPGPEAAASQFGLLLTLSETTLGDVYEARIVIEPAAAGRLARHRKEADLACLANELECLREVVDSLSDFGPQTVRFHRRIVELAGNRTLATVVGMLSEIIAQHITKAYIEHAPPSDELNSQQHAALRAYERLIEFVRAGDQAGAEAFWHKHMRAVRDIVLDRAREDETQVVDLLY